MSLLELSPNPINSTPPPGTPTTSQPLEFDPTETLLHYYQPVRPHAPALCGEPAPQEGWDSATTQKENNPLGLCPACRVLHTSLKTTSTGEHAA